MLCTREVTVQVPDGLHHQTAARFIQTANRFTSVVRVVYGDNNVNAKSLLGVLSLSRQVCCPVTNGKAWVKVPALPSPLTH